jgi:hypothetical protein
MTNAKEPDLPGVHLKSPFLQLILLRDMPANRFTPFDLPEDFIAQSTSKKTHKNHNLQSLNL